MKQEAKGEFQVTAWDEKTYDELGGGGKLTEARIGQDFSGDIAAFTSATLLMCYRPDGTATYNGLQRVRGRLEGREGDFVLQVEGAYDGGHARSALTVLAGSGSGGLAGLTGSGEAVAGHGSTGTYSLRYELA